METPQNENDYDVMILAVVAVMIAKAVNVNNKMEMGK